LLYQRLVRHPKAVKQALPETSHFTFGQGSPTAGIAIQADVAALLADLASMRQKQGEVFYGKVSDSFVCDQRRQYQCQDLFAGSLPKQKGRRLSLTGVSKLLSEGQNRLGLPLLLPLLSL